MVYFFFLLSTVQDFPCKFFCYLPDKCILTFQKCLLHKYNYLYFYTSLYIRLILILSRAWYVEPFIFSYYKTTFRVIYIYIYGSRFNKLSVSFYLKFLWDMQHLNRSTSMALKFHRHADYRKRPKLTTNIHLKGARWKLQFRKISITIITSFKRSKNRYKIKRPLKVYLLWSVTCKAKYITTHIQHIICKVEKFSGSLI